MTFFILTVSSVIIFRPILSILLKGLSLKVQKKYSEPRNQKGPDSQGNTAFSVTGRHNPENGGQITPEKQTEKTVPAFLISEEKVSSIKSKEHQKRIQDTAEAPQKIIVVKKIIQRDTVYIER
ncbi:hypothetical protein EJ377_15380 [Chryseobacterium arthrosphaerae]|uniref:Uncharacterized protein n=1 Tax=Chryseobacterium arthrosphaerae TaxID=651561 RepID=A0A3S0N1I4_9FLAO|nr:hypothetical protein EJ377_15380 [Chryseobacterium arthrosphaerae]